MRKFVACALIAALAFALSACTLFAPAGTDSMDSDRYQLSYTGKTLTVKLVENQSTGWLWHLSADNDNIVLVDDDYMRGGGLVAPSGQGGTHTYHFEGASEGTTTITFENYRNYEPDNVSAVLLIAVEINSDGSIKSAAFDSVTHQDA